MPNDNGGQATRQRIAYRREGLAVGVGGTSPHGGRAGHTSTMQHAVSSDIRLAKKHTLSPCFALPIVTVTVVDSPFCKGLLRFVSSGLRLNVPPAAGVKKICDIGLPELFATLNV